VDVIKGIFRDSISGLTHLFGAVFTIIGTVFLLINSYGDYDKFVCYLIFGVSMILLFSASATYHLVTGPEKLIRVCKIIDHCMIYVLIAGTYTAVVSSFLDGYYYMLLGIWFCAFVGIILKIFLTGKFRKTSTLLYILMGWSIVFRLKELSNCLSLEGLVLLVAGGIFYTIGGVIYGMKKPNISEKFGFHELFHIFVLLGAISHFILVYKYLP